jgi:multidrug efflux pump subunit AcrA (membrane-fusion protein)
LRQVLTFLSDLLDKVREPGWPRRITVLAVILLILLFPYPIHIPGEFEIITLKPTEVRTLVDGVLLSVRIKAGEEVKEGQMVADILDVGLEAEKSRLRGELNELRRILESRGINLGQIEDGPRRDQPEIARSIEIARMLTVRLSELEKMLDWSTVRAPSSGVVVTPDHEIQKMIGQNIHRGTALFEVVDPKALVARVAVPENEFGDVAVGQEVALRTYQFPTETIAGVVDEIEPRVWKHGEFSTTVPVLVKVDGNGEKLRPRSTGIGKIDCGTTVIGHLIWRRFLRSLWVRIWSWY